MSTGENVSSRSLAHRVAQPRRGLLAAVTSKPHSSFDIMREIDNLIAARDGGFYEKSRAHELNVVNFFRSLVEQYERLSECDCVPSEFSSMSCQKCGRRATITQEHFLHIVAEAERRRGIEEQKEATEHQADVMRDVLTRLRQWDVLNLPPGSGDDGPYWRGEIDRALSYPASVPLDSPHSERVLRDIKAGVEFPASEPEASDAS